MLVDEIENYYKGQLPEETKKWIGENCRYFTEEESGNFKKVLFEQSSKLPDIQKLKNILEKETGKKPRIYIWAVCLECGCEYDYGLPMCPACYDKGLDCRAKAVKKSEFQPPKKVIKYNKQYLNGDKGETVCFNCVHKKQSYCKNYGNPNWTCGREEFESCACSRCCSLAKRFNEKLKDTKQTISYAVPLKKV